MTSITKSIFQAWALLLLLWMGSCRKFDASWDTELLTPLITSSIDVGDLFGDSNIMANPDQSLSLIYQQKFQLLSTDSLISFSDTVSKEGIVIPISLNLPPGQKVVEKESETPLDFGDMQLKFAKAKKARLRFIVQSSITQPLKIQYDLLSATKDGNYFSMTEKIPAATPGTSITYSTTIDLNDYEVDMRGPLKDKFNTIYAKTHIWIHPDGDTVKVLASDSIIVLTLFEEFIPLYARGYLGSKTFQQTSVEPIGLFESLKGGSFNLQEAKATLEFYNFGIVDFRLRLNSLTAINNKNQLRLPLQDKLIGRNINLMRGIENSNGNPSIYPSYQRFEIFESNLNELFNLQPDSLEMNLEAHINPLGNISGTNDFYSFDQGLETYLKLEVPLNLSANNLVFSEVSSLAFESEEILGGELFLHYENFFPFELQLQLYLLNDQQQVIDSLFHSKLIVQPSNPVAGIAQQPTSGKSSVQLTPALLQNLRQARHIRTEARISSKDHQPYQLYEHYKLNIKVIGDFDYGVQ